jgi:hypothetical protein
MIGNGCVLAKSRKQKIVTKDSTEAELVALSDMLPLVEQCNELLRCQGYDCGVPTVCQDNQSTITLVTENGGVYRNIHLRARRGVVHERIENGEINIVFVRAHRMIADGLTKPLQGALGRSLNARIMLGRNLASCGGRQGCVGEIANSHPTPAWSRGTPTLRVGEIANSHPAPAWYRGTPTLRARNVATTAELPPYARMVPRNSNPSTRPARPDPATRTRLCDQSEQQ